MYELLQVHYSDYVTKNGRTRARPTGVSPRHGFHAAALVACDAFNARTATEREYHYQVSVLLIYCAAVILRAFFFKEHIRLEFHLSACKSTLAQVGG